MNKQQLLESLKSKGFSKPILRAFEKVEREDFVPKHIKPYAYEDNAQPIGHCQTTSQPYTIGVMLDLLDLKPRQKVLEVGSGSGYVLALLSQIVGKKGKVYGIDIIKALVEQSREVLKGYENVMVYHRDGNLGLKEKAPFSRILISAALKQIPKTLIDQLKQGGILVAPIGARYEQALIAFEKKKDKLVIKKEILGFIFVPFVKP